jgi:hypothetical protein
MSLKSARLPSLRDKLEQAKVVQEAEEKAVEKDETKKVVEKVKKLKKENE